MKKAFKIASTVHFIYWVCILLLCIIERITYSDPGAEPLDYYMSIGIYNMLIGMALAGVFTALLLLGCVHFVCNHTIPGRRAFDKVMLVASAISCIMYYSYIGFIFIINKDSVFVIVAPIIWAISAITCLIMLIFSQIKKHRTTQEIQKI